MIYPKAMKWNRQTAYLYDSLCYVATVPEPTAQQINGDSNIG